MLHLKITNGSVTNNPSVMRKITIDFYVNLFSSGNCDAQRVTEVVEGLLQLEEAQAASLESPFTLEEMTAVMNQLSCGCFPGIDGLPAEFYKSFWTILG